METSVSFFYVLSVMNLLYVPLSGAHRGAPAARAAPPRESEENPCFATKFCTSVWNLHPLSSLNNFKIMAHKFICLLIIWLRWIIGVGNVCAYIIFKQ